MEWKAILEGVGNPILLGTYLLTMGQLTTETIHPGSPSSKQRTMILRQLECSFHLFLASLTAQLKQPSYTPWNSDFAPENRPFGPKRKRESIPTIHFQVLDSGRVVTIWLFKKPDNCFSKTRRGKQSPHVKFDLWQSDSPVTSQIFYQATVTTRFPFQLENMLNFMTPNWKVCFDNSSSIQKSTSKTQVYGGLSEGQNRLRKIPQKCLVGCVGLKILQFKYYFQPKTNQKHVQVAKLSKKKTCQAIFGGWRVLSLQPGQVSRWKLRHGHSWIAMRCGASAHWGLGG